MSEEEFYSKALSFDEVGMQVDIFEKEKIKYQQQIDQLTNNWNELEKYFKQHGFWHSLDKMKEIKEGNK